MRRVISLLLSIIMIIGVMPIAVMAAEDHSTRLDETPTAELINGSYFYLDGDLKLKEDIKVNGQQNITICLHGHKLDLNGHYIEVDNGGKLTIKSCCGKKGIITGGNSDNPPIRVYGELSLDNIKITGNINTRSSGASSNQMYGGAIWSQGILTINNCIIENNTAKNGGGLVLYEMSDAHPRTTIKNSVIRKNKATSPFGNDILYTININKAGGCFIAGTKIRMADETEKNIEDVRNGDLIKAFDHETGTLVDAVACEYYMGPEKSKATTLHFASGNEISIVSSHDFFEKESLKYVAVDEDNVNDYVGHHFYNAVTGTWDKLVRYSCDGKLYNYYTIYTEKTLNCIANNMVTLDCDVEMFVNIFEFDEELKIDQVQKQKDIDKYGLGTKEELPIDDIYFEKYNHKYFPIVIGKGLKTMEELLSMYDETIEIEKDNQAKKLTKVTPYSEPVMLSKAILPMGGVGNNANNTYLVIENSIIGDIYLDDNITFTAKNGCDIGITTEKLPTSPTNFVRISEGEVSGKMGVHSNMEGYKVVVSSDNILGITIGQEPVVVEENEPDPEVEVELGGKNLSLEYGNDTVVFSKEAYEKTKDSSLSADGKNFRLDFRDANFDVLEAIVPKDIIQDLAKQGKGLEFENRHGFMVIEELEGKTNNSVVIGVRDDVASYAHVKATGTKHVEAEFSIVYKANGKEINGDATVYIPCDIAEPRLFYIIDDNTMGEVPCRVSGGYCVFDRYLDGKYVVCK